MRAKVYRKLTWEKLKNIIPKQYRALTSIIPRDKDAYAAIIFPADNETLLSSEVKKALEKVSVCDGEHIVFCAYNVTSEAYDAIEVTGATFLRLYNLFWTDESLLRITKMH